MEALKKLGLNATRVERDPLFFLTCLLPICDPQRSGIEGDNRMPFFTHARACTNIYSVGPRGWGGGYGHDYKNANEAELVCIRLVQLFAMEHGREHRDHSTPVGTKEIQI